MKCWYELLIALDGTGNHRRPEHSKSNEISDALDWRVNAMNVNKVMDEIESKKLIPKGVAAGAKEENAAAVLVGKGSTPLCTTRTAYLLSSRVASETTIRVPLID